jgi:hypothetical protein
MLDRKQSDFKEASSEELSFVSPDGEIESELKRILSSDFFKSSARCRDFLKHVVWVACSESPESLKERTIGIAVFGRAPDYDTGADAIVRVKATEVRRRLAQYNQSADPHRPVAIELNPGSYAPKITRRTYPEALPEDVTTKRPPGKIVIGAAIASLCLGLVWAIYAISFAASPVKKFWRPFFGNDRLIICISNPAAYYLSVDELAKHGDSAKAFYLSEKLQSIGLPNRIAIANDVSASDLKASPVLLLGGPKYNRWTRPLMQDLRFTFQLVDNKARIVDRDAPTRFWDDQNLTADKASEDYVVVTRLVDSSFGKAVICVAGLKAAGTRAGAELIVNPAFLKKASRFAPEDWEKKNLQFVVRIDSKGEFHDGSLMAATYW